MRLFATLNGNWCGKVGLWLEEAAISQAADNASIGTLVDGIIFSDR